MVQNKKILITGAGNGIGFQLAAMLAEKGAKLILLDKDKTGLEKIDDHISAMAEKDPSIESPTLLSFDLADFKSYDQLGLALFQKFGQLDACIANAAVLKNLGPVASFNKSHFSEIMDVNVKANFYLIQTLTPLLKLSSYPRFIFVTDQLDQAPQSFWGSYRASKAALEALVISYAEEMQKTDFKINMIDPGLVSTHMRVQAYPGEPPSLYPFSNQAKQLFLDCLRNECLITGQKLTVSAQSNQPLASKAA